MAASLGTGVLGLAVQDSRGHGRPGRKGTLLALWLAWAEAGGARGSFLPAPHLPLTQAHRPSTPERALDSLPLGLWRDLERLSLKMFPLISACFLDDGTSQLLLLSLFSYSVVSNSLLPQDCSTPGLPVCHQLLELAQTHVHQSVILSSHLILCHPLLLLPSTFPSIEVFSTESVLCIRWPKYWSFNLSISPSSEYSGLISFRIDWLDLLAVQRTLKSLPQHHSSKASILWHSAFFLIQLSHPYVQFSSVQFSRSVVSDSLQPHESQHARPPCPSPTPRVHSDLRPSSQ